MSQHLQFELVSPEKLLLSKNVVLVSVPGGEGDYGILPGHAPMITTVRSGVIEIYEHAEHTVTDRLFVAGGFAEVNGERCTVLAEEALLVSEIDRSKVEEQIKNLTEELASSQIEEETRQEIESKIQIAHAKLRALAA